MIDFLEKKRILVVVAHPDDEILGPGATLHRLIKDFDTEVKVLILGEGITSRADQRDPTQWDDELSEHRANIEAAREAIGFSEVIIHNFADNRFDSVDLLDLIKAIEKIKADFVPEVVFTHHGGDVNIDHQRTFEAVITACRPLTHECVKCIVTFPTASGTEWRASTDPKHFIPNWFVSISEENFSAKVKAMESYTYEKRPFPHPRSPEALRIFAAHAGMTNGVPLAEAFHIVRCIS